MLTTILALITSFLKSIPFFDKWFTKTEAAQQSDAEKTIQDQIDRMKNEGRP